MNYALYTSILGTIRIEYEGECVTLLKKTEDSCEARGQKTAFTDAVFSQVEEYLSGKRKTFTFAYELAGTDFQKKVWAALCDIPYGETRTYKEVAMAIGNEKASRAVGMANNKNPIHLAVPCHRVIGTGGKLVGYAGGLGMKEYLLKTEREHKE